METVARQKVLWFVTGATALVASGLGVGMPAVYEGLVTDRIMPGVIAQDLMSIGLAGVLLWLVAYARKPDLHLRLLATGLLVYFFYAYGIYTIERIYNELYIAYLAIFGLSAFGTIDNIAGIVDEVASRLSVPRWVRNVAAGYLILNAIVFVGLWTSQLVPLIQAREKIEFLYSIYILDLCFIMPAFVVVAVMAVRDRALGLVGMPPLLVSGFTILFPLALAELLKPLMFGQPIDVGALVLFSGLSGVFLALAVVYLATMQWRVQTDARRESS